MENYGKPKKRIRKGLQTKDELESRLLVEKLLTPYCAYPNTVPLIK